MKNIMKLLIFIGVASSQICSAMEVPKEQNIFQAAAIGNIDRIQELLAQGVHIDSECKGEEDGIGDVFRNTTPLILSVIFQKPEAVEMLIKSGANLYIVRNNQTTAFDLALIFNNSKIINTFKKNAPQAFFQYWIKRSHSLLYQTWCNNKNTCAFLIRNGADILFQEENRGDLRNMLWRDNAFIRCEMSFSIEALQAIVTNSFFLPEINPSEPTIISSIGNALSWLPGCNRLKTVTPSQRVKTILLCAKQKKLPRDIQNLLLLYSAKDELISLMLAHIARGGSIPKFAADIITEVCYKSTYDKIWPYMEAVVHDVLPHHLNLKEKGNKDLQKVDRAIAPWLKKENFEKNYGDQLRANIKARLCNRDTFLNEFFFEEQN